MREVVIFQRAAAELYRLANAARERHDNMQAIMFQLDAARYSRKARILFTVAIASGSE